MLELLSEIHFCYKDWLIWFLLTAVSIYCISFLSLQCHTAPVRRGKQKLLKVVDVLVITYQIAQTSDAIAVSVPFFSPLQVKKEVKQYPVVGETTVVWTSQVKWRGCKLMIQWEIVYAIELLQQLPSFPHASSLFHGLAFLPFTPALSLSADVICPAYVVT